MKKIVMIAAPIHSIPPRTGAAVEWWMYQVSQRLIDFEAHIIAIGKENELASETLQDVAFHRIKIGRLYKRVFQKITRLDPWSYARRANRIIDQINADIVHVHNSPPLFHRLLLLNRNSRRQYVLHMHNEKSTTCIPENSNMFVVSQYLEQYYRKQLPKINIRVITNGVDTEAFKPKWLMKSLPPFPSLDNHLPLDKKVILYVGRMSPEKGPLKLANAFAELIRKRNDVFLLMVGEFSKGDNDRARYGMAIRDRCIAFSDNCLLLDALPPEQIRHVYYRANLIVIPSEFQDPFPMVPIEAMAAGIPVMATRRGGIPELISEPERGIFINDLDNPVTFAQQLNKTIDDIELLKMMAQSGRRYVEEHHDWSQVARLVTCSYQCLLEE